MTLRPRLSLRPEPLAPRGVIASGDVALALARRALARGLEGLRGVASPAGAPRLLVLLGEALPWADGVTYLGCEPEAPRVHLPTTHRFVSPSGTPLGAALIEGALAHGPVPGPWAIAPGVLVGLEAARAIDRDRLEAWAR